MRVLFIYTDLSSEVGYSSGIGILSAILKKNGHQTKLIHVSDEIGYPLDNLRINRDIHNFQPGLICFSITTNHWFSSRRIGISVRQNSNTPIIVGGHHPTSDPEQVIREPWIDLLCRGEGDRALPEVVRRLEAGTPMDGIPNIFHKRNGQVFRERILDWVEDLDTLPVEDHEIFNFGKIVETRNGWAEVIVTRGCPYPCSYCFNKPLLNDYKRTFEQIEGLHFDTKKFTNRRRSVDAVISMLKGMKEGYPNIEHFTFVDDIMAQDSPWFRKFAERYADEIGLPYACTSQPLLFNENLARLLKASGCKVVKMGIEAGNENIRRTVLNRRISNEYLEKVFHIAREFDLKPQAFNMIGIPGETFKNMMETVRLNALLRPYIVWLSTFNPYPGTELYKKCLEKNMINQSKIDSVESYREDSVLKDEFLPPLEFKKIRVMFRWHLNAFLANGAEKVYRENIREIDGLSDDHWRNGEAEKIFLERDRELDRHFRHRLIDHYIRKKYINILWGELYNYDLT